MDTDPENERTRRVESLQLELELLQVEIDSLKAEIDEHHANLRGHYLKMGLKQALQQSFCLLEFDGRARWAAEAVSEEQHRILETFGFPIDGYTLLRRLAVEHERRMMANARHSGAKERIQRIRQEWESQRTRYPNKLSFAEEIASREAVDFKTVYDRWLKGI